MIVFYIKQQYTLKNSYSVVNKYVIVSSNKSAYALLILMYIKGSFFFLGLA